MSNAMQSNSSEQCIIIFQVRAATWALEHDTSVVITNGFKENAILNVVNGKKMGTFFTPVKAQSTPIEIQAAKGITWCLILVLFWNINNE